MVHYTTIVTPEISWLTTTSGSVINSGWTNNIAVSDTTFSTGDKLYLDIFRVASSPTTEAITDSPYYLFENGGAL